jgi:hypothetical protein
LYIHTDSFGRPAIGGMTRTVSHQCKWAGVGVGVEDFYFSLLEIIHLNIFFFQCDSFLDTRPLPNKLPLPTFLF